MPFISFSSFNNKLSSFELVGLKKEKAGLKGKKKTSFLGKVGKAAWSVAKWTPAGMAARGGLWAGKKLFGAGKSLFKKSKGSGGFFSRIGSLLSGWPFGIIRRIISRVRNLIGYVD